MLDKCVIDERVLFNAGFNKSYSYHFLRSANSDDTVTFNYIHRYSALYFPFRMDDRLRELKESYAPVIKPSRVHRELSYTAITPDRISNLIEIARFEHHIETDDDMIFALRTMIWYSAQQILAFWGPRFYCVYKAIGDDWRPLDLRDAIVRIKYGEPGRR